MKNVGLIILTFAFIFFQALQAQEQFEKPNVLVILADDLGYGDLQCYNKNSLIPTPNLDQLASEGMRLTNAYCPVAVCSPSRYALMTGNYPFRSWKSRGVMANYEPSMMDKEDLTLPEMMQQAGYFTAGFGKWHLGTTFPTLDDEKPAGYGKFRADDNGANLDLSRPVSDGPVDHGFNHWLGFSCASECWILKDNKIAAALDHDFYTIEATPNKDDIELIAMDEYFPFITGHTIDFIKNYEQEQPFFLYFAPYVPHIPFSVSEEFQGKTKAGLYGDYVRELDYYLGQLLKTLQETGRAENTLIIFASDNGSQFTFSSDQVDMRDAANRPDGGFSKEGLTYWHEPNYPLRATKWTAYEGGVRTPLLVKWPGRVAGKSVNHSIFTLNDVIATLAGILDFNLPTDVALDSHNQAEVLLDNSEGTRQFVVVQSSGRQYGLRWKDWKYIQASKNESAELYNLKDDVSETMNLVNEEKELVAKLEKWLQEMLASDATVKR